MGFTIQFCISFVNRNIPLLYIAWKRNTNLFVFNDN